MAESAVKRRMSKIALDEGALTSDDPQAQVASRGWAQIAELPLVKKALDFQGNLKEYDDIVTRAMPSLDKKTGAFTPGNQEAGVELAERALGTVTSTLKAPQGKLPKKYVDQILSESKDSLFHSTTKKNIESIKKSGLYPQTGNIVKDAYGDSLQIMAENGQDVEEIAFLAENPSAFYSHWQGLKKGQYPNYDDIKLHDLNKKGGAGIFKRQEDIYQAVENERGVVNPLKSTDKTPAEYFPEDMPVSVERNDYFTFNRQDPEHVFSGTDYIELVTKKDPDFINNMPKKQKKLLESLKDLPSKEFQAQLKAALKKDKSLGVALGIGGAAGAASQGDDGAMKRRLHNQGDN